MFYKSIWAAVILFAAGCSDPKDANEKNFEAAVQSYLDTQYPKCYFRQKFPATIDVDIGGRREILRALAKAGMVLEKEESRREIPVFGGGKTVVVKSTFDLTQNGREFYKDGAANRFDTNIGGFCVGKATVKAVSQFSEPSDMFGQRVSRVNYTYVVSDLPGWSRSPELLAAVSALKVDVESAATPIKAIETLILTNKGWVHEQLFKQ